MPPVVLKPIHSTHLVVTLLQLAYRHVPTLLHHFGADIGDEGNTATAASAAITPSPSMPRRFAKRELEKDSPEFIVFACLIPILVLLSGLFAGLTLGYMSLDETQLNVLSISGTPQQKQYANKIKPIRKNGHLLLVTLLLANMIVNESLPVIADPVLGGGVQSVVVSTVLIVIFAEVIPQSVCTRYGLAVGATMAPFVKVLLCTIGLLAWPVAKLLEVVLGPHHGIIYRRGELKELIQIHEDSATHGGDLKHDTVTIIGATLDLQEKVVKHAMTPISDVFMLSIDAVLDYDTLHQICQTGHSRVPVYEEVEVPFGYGGGDVQTMRKEHVKKLVGILLVKQCVLLDPSDAVPVRKIPLNKVPFVPQNEPLLGILDRFQEGRSHMAIVTRFSREKAESVKQVVKTGLTQRLRNRVGMGDSSSDSSSCSSDDDDDHKSGEERHKPKNKRRGRTGRKTSGETSTDVEMGVVQPEGKARASFQLPLGGNRGFEQSMPADAVLGKEGAEEFLQSLDPAVAPLGIITLEDVLEELIGEEIYDEFDPETEHHLTSYIPEPSTGEMSTSHPGAPQSALSEKSHNDALPERPSSKDVDKPISKSATSTPLLRPIAVPAIPALPGLKNLSLFTNTTRSRSAPPTPQGGKKSDLSTAVTGVSEGHSSPVAEAQGVSVLGEDTPDGAITPTEAPTIMVEEASPVKDGPRRAEPTTVTFADAPTIAGAPLHAPTPVHAQPASAIPPGVQASLSAPTSRTGSPAPSLEALILGSKRRQQQQQQAGPAGSGLAATHPVHPKGMSFKSTPLRGGAAERIMQGLRVGERNHEEDEKMIGDDSKE